MLSLGAAPLDCSASGPPWVWLASGGWALLAAVGAALAVALGEPDDELLVQRAQGGELAAFSALVRRHQDRVYSLCLRWLRDPALAEEVAQDVFISVHRALPGFRGEARFTTWLTRVTVNHCKNKRLYESRRARDRHEPLEGLARPDRPDRELADERAGTDRALQRSEASALLLAALDALDEGHRAVIVLRDLEDLNYDEIAELLSVPVGTVKSRLHRARHQLALALGRRMGAADL